MRWACILLTRLALDGVQRGRDDADAPLVLVSGHVPRRLIRAVNAQARALGLRPGMSLTAAQTLVTDFAVAEYDEQQISHWQHFLAAWAYRYSSHVSLDYPHALLLEVESSLGLFGPWPRFEQRLREDLTGLGFQHRIVLAPNPAAARALTNVHDGLAVMDSLA
ncbi:MAG: DNA polymerase Y family protein, partial [Pseudomonas formosensis]|nr:DNA polymerase Y family protein [Halopseudomonas formosensis]